MNYDRRRLSQGVFVPGTNGFTKLRQTRRFLRLLQSQVWAGILRGQDTLLTLWGPPVTSGGGQPDMTTPPGEEYLGQCWNFLIKTEEFLASSGVQEMQISVWWKCSRALNIHLTHSSCIGTIPRLGFHREVPNTNHCLTCHFSRTCNKMGDEFIKWFVSIYLN